MWRAQGHSRDNGPDPRGPGQQVDYAKDSASFACCSGISLGAITKAWLATRTNRPFRGCGGAPRLAAAEFAAEFRARRGARRQTCARPNIVRSRIERPQHALLDQPGLAQHSHDRPVVAVHFHINLPQRQVLEQPVDEQSGGEDSAPQYRRFPR